MRPSLRELFRAPDALEEGVNPLVRLGALHYLRRNVERDQVRRQLETLLKSQDIEMLLRGDPSLSVFPLHVAVALCQEGGEEGVRWLLRYLSAARQRHQRLASTALRNCRQFPLAVLLGSAIEGSALEAAYESLGDLCTFSDESAWVMATGTDRTAPLALVAALRSAFQGVMGSVRADRGLAWGTVITRPLQRPLVGLRYTGFVIVEDPSGSLRGVPYQMSDLINRDDGAGRMTASELLRQPGRRVLVSFDAGDQQRALAIYALPFVALEDANGLIARAALSCAGLDIGVVAHRWDSHGVAMYRLITASGGTEVGYDQQGRTQVGSCALLHASSTRPFLTRFSLSDPDAERVLAGFVRTNPLEKATPLKAYGNGYKLGADTGQILVVRGVQPTTPVLLIEKKVIKAREQVFEVKLPSNPWGPEDRSIVLEQFFTKNTSAFAIVLATVAVPGGGQNALIVNPALGVNELRRTNAVVSPGTPAVWEVDEKTIQITFLEDQSVRSVCSICFDARQRPCPTCEGKGRGPCSSCEGTKKSRCDHCSGTGERRSDCHGCRGTGNCGNCSGRTSVTLKCTICQGTGRYADSGRPCKKCGGIGTFSGTCRVCTRGPQPPGKCPNCKGSGDYVQNCKSCGATGRWNCAACRATGIGPCDTCEGTRLTACSCAGPAKVRVRLMTRGGDHGVR